jgi:hypothetical protein
LCWAGVGVQAGDESFELRVLDAGDGLWYKTLK